jgi:hypothetical protein
MATGDFIIANRVTSCRTVCSGEFFGQDGAAERMFQNGGYVNTYRIEYQVEERQPHLARNETKPKLLKDIFAPRANDAPLKPAHDLFDLCGYYPTLGNLGKLLFTTN